MKPLVSEVNFTPSSTAFVSLPPLVLLGSCVVKIVHGQLDGTGVAVFVGVGVFVGMGVFVGVDVGVLVGPPGVLVAVGVRVGVGVLVGEVLVANTASTQ